MEPDDSRFKLVGVVSRCDALNRLLAYVSCRQSVTPSLNAKYTCSYKRLKPLDVLSA